MMKASSIVGRLGVALFFLLLLCFAVLNAPDTKQITDCRDSGETPVHYTFDALHGYLPQISGEQPVDNWHSAFFMYEGKMVYKALKLIFPAKATPLHALVAIWHGCIFITITNLSIWLLWFARKSLWYFILVIPMTYMAMHVITDPLTLDVFFYAPLTLFFTFCVLLVSRYSRKSKLCIIILLLFALMHMMELRQNSAIFLPCVFYLAISKFIRKKRVCISIAFLGSICLYSLSFSKVTAVFFPVEERFPLTPMMESDMRIAAVLENKQAELRKDFAALGYIKSDNFFQDSLTAGTGADRETGKEIDVPMWNAYYLNKWRSNTRNMLYAKAIQVIQFYCGGKLPVPVQKYTETRYPAVRDNPKAMYVCGDWTPMRVWVPKLLIIFCSMFLTAVIVFRRARHSQPWIEEHLCILFGLLFAASYALSYLIVTPTPDSRYLTPSVCIGAIAITAYIVANMIKERVNVPTPACMGKS